MCWQTSTFPVGKCRYPQNSSRTEFWLKFWSLKQPYFLLHLHCLFSSVSLVIEFLRYFFRSTYSCFWNFFFQKSTNLKEIMVVFWHYVKKCHVWNTLFSKIMPNFWRSVKLICSQNMHKNYIDFWSKILHFKKFHNQTDIYVQLPGLHTMRKSRNMNRSK